MSNIPHMLIFELMNISIFGYYFSKDNMLIDILEAFENLKRGW